MKEKPVPGNDKRLRELSRFARRVLPLLPFLIAACGGSDSGSGGSSVSLEAAFPSSLADAFCSSAAACCKATFYKDSCAHDVSTRDSVIPQGQSGATAKFDQRAASGCLNALTLAAGQCDSDLTEIAVAWDICQTVYRGTKQAGEACMQSTDCVAVANSTRLCSDSVCTYSPVEIISPVGGPCVSNASPAPGQPAYRCDKARYEWCNSSTGQCAPPVPAGGLCADKVIGSGTCVAGYACMSKNGSPAKCLPAHGAGDACWPPECDISSDPMLCACGSDSACDSGNTDVCVTKAAPGQPCPADSFGDQACLGACKLGHCVTDAQAATWAPYCG